MISFLSHYVKDLYNMFKKHILLNSCTDIYNYMTVWLYKRLYKRPTTLIFSFQFLQFI